MSRAGADGSASIGTCGVCSGFFVGLGIGAKGGVQAFSTTTSRTVTLSSSSLSLTSITAKPSISSSSGVISCLSVTGSAVEEDDWKSDGEGESWMSSFSSEVATGTSALNTVSPPGSVDFMISNACSSRSLCSGSGSCS